MRTTVSIDDHLLARAKERAMKEGVTLGMLIERTLQETLSGRASPTEPIELPVFTEGIGLVPGIEPTSRGLLAALDEPGDQPA